MFAAPSTPRATSLCRKTAKCLHVLPHEFLVDAQDGIRDPIGMVGQRLEANVHLVTSSVAATQNLVTAANRAGILISDTVLEPLASAESCLTQDERDLGCCLLDIGGGTTELIVYGGGVVRHTGAVAVGGDHFTNDLAVGLRTPIPEAERIKRHHGCAAASMLQRRRRHRNRQRRRSPAAHHFRAHAHRYHRAPRPGIAGADSRRFAARRARQANPRGIRARRRRRKLHGLIELAEQSFHLPVRIAEPKGLGDMPEQVAQPEYATVVGLVLYGAKARRAAPQRAGIW